MNRIASGICLAAAFSFAASLGAQTPTTSASSSAMSHEKDIVVTGCLQRGADGNYMLTNAKMDESAHAGASTTTGTTGTSGTSTTAGAATSGSAMGSSAASSWTLEGGTDLDKHVGHKIQVTGQEVNSSSKNDMGTTGSGTSATGTTATTGTTGTSGSEASSQRSSSAHTGPKLDVTSVKMISSSCS